LISVEITMPAGMNLAGDNVTVFLGPNGNKRAAVALVQARVSDWRSPAVQHV
jgi:hypothetical protein